MRGPRPTGEACGASAFRPSLPALVFAALTVPLVMQASIALTFQTVGGGISLNNSGTNDADINFGTVSRYGSIGANITRTLGASDWTVSSPIGVLVTKSAESSTSYTLRARVTATGTASRLVNNITMTTSFVTVASNQAYATTFSHTVGQLTPDSAAAGNYARDLEFQAIAD